MNYLPKKKKKILDLDLCFDELFIDNLKVEAHIKIINR